MIYRRLKVIKETVENVFEIKDISKKSRKNRVVWSRYIYYTLAKKYTKFSLAIIGEKVKRDHATVLHGLREIEKIDQYKSEGYPSALRECISVLDLYFKEKEEQEIQQENNFITRIKELEKQIDDLEFKLFCEKQKNKYKMKKLHFIEDSLNEIPLNKINEFHETRIIPFAKMHSQKTA